MLKVLPMSPHVALLFRTSDKTSSSTPRLDSPSNHLISTRRHHSFSSLVRPLPDPPGYIHQMLPFPTPALNIQLSHILTRYISNLGRTAKHPCICSGKHHIAILRTTAVGANGPIIHHCGRRCETEFRGFATIVVRLDTLHLATH